MGTPLSASQMLSVLKKEGVKVVEHAGWETAGRDKATGKTFGPVRGLILHHTAGADSSAGLNIVKNGRSDLPGPLAHVYITKNGDVHLLSVHRANHAGLGDDDVLHAVINETALPKPNENNTDGNDSFWGAEIANLGNGKDPYPAAQYDAAVRWAAAICRAHGWSEKSVIGHKEWTNQKIDPSFSMTKFRADVKAQLSGTYKKTTEEKTTTVTTAVPGGPYQIDASYTTGGTLVPGTWYDVTFSAKTTDEAGQITVGSSVITGKGTYSGTIYVQATGVAEGDEVQLRLVEKDSTGVILKYLPIVEGLGSAGGTYFAVPINGLLPAGRTLAVQVLNSTDSNIVLNNLTLKAQWWIRS